MTFRTQRPLDSHDWSILRELQADARLSFKELARRVGLSSPAVAERVRRMEDAGVIAGYHAQVDPAKIGLPVMAPIQLRCQPGKCLIRTERAEDYPEVLEMLKVSGEYCNVLKVAVGSVNHLEEFNERLGQHGELRTTMIWGSALTRRVLDWEGGVPDVPPVPGWE